MTEIRRAPGGADAGRASLNRDEVTPPPSSLAVPRRVARRGPPRPWARAAAIARRLAVRDVLGVLWVLGAAGAVMAPALAHGTSLGPFDLLSRYGLTQHAGVAVNNGQATDQIAEMIPWSALAWTQVHQGHLPLWDPYNALGLPLAFNWQSGAFSLPGLLSYLAPLRLAYTVQVLFTLGFAGLGAYVFGRVLKLGVVGSALAATIFELSGPFMGFLGWPISSVMSWAGWLFAAIVVVVRGRRGAWAVAGLAVAVAGAIYAGQPDALVVLVPAMAVFALVLLVNPSARGDGARRPWQGVAGLVSGGVAGAALSAPLLLPGLQLVSGSVFTNSARVNSGLSAQSLVTMLLPGYSATVLTQSHWFDVGAADYLGVIAVVLAAMGVAVFRRRPHVMALTVTGAVMFVVAFAPGVTTALNTLPFRARWHLAVVIVAFAVAMLAGVGIDRLLRAVAHQGEQWSVRAWLLGGFGVSALLLVALWIVGPGSVSPQAVRLRSHSLIWPAVQTALGLAVWAAFTVFRSRPWARLRWWALVLVACETAFLAAVGASTFSSSSTFVQPTPAEATLASVVGSSLVGFGSKSCELPPTLGILPEANALFGVHELSAYDPLTPRGYFRALHAQSTLPASAFCPVLTDATVARRFGVGFILIRPGHKSPSGTVGVGYVGDEVLFAVPGAAQATWVARPVPGVEPALDAPGTPIAVTHSDPARWRLVTDDAAPGVVRLHLTDVPGWHATIDGRPLQLSRYGGVMLQADVPAGHHVVELSYLPRAFTIGVVLALVSVAALSAAVIVRWWRRRGIPGRSP
jgi:hypothetical protein